MALLCPADFKGGLDSLVCLFCVSKWLNLDDCAEVDGHALNVKLDLILMVSYKLCSETCKENAYNIGVISRL